MTAEFNKALYQAKLAEQMERYQGALAAGQGLTALGCLSVFVCRDGRVHETSAPTLDRGPNRGNAEPALRGLQERNRKPPVRLESHPGNRGETVEE